MDTDRTSVFENRFVLREARCFTAKNSQVNVKNKTCFIDQCVDQDMLT